MVAGRAVLVRGVDDGTVLVYDPDTQQAAAVPWERVMVSTASATRPIRIRLTEPQADELTVRVNDMFDGDPVRDASYGMRVRFRSWLDVHDPASALSELDNALDIITDNLRSGGGDGQERTRWRSHQRVVENVRAKLVEAALPRQRPATPPAARRLRRSRSGRRRDAPARPAPRRPALDPAARRPRHPCAADRPAVGQPGPVRVPGRPTGRRARRRRQRRSARPRAPHPMAPAAPPDSRAAHGPRRDTTARQR